MVEKIIQFRQLELPLKWYEVDWSHGGVITDISRPTEDTALENVGRQARLLKSVREPTMDNMEWSVYCKDLELQFKHKNSNTITAIDIAKALGMQALEVEDILRRIDNVMSCRDLLGMPILPPIPFEFIGRMKQIRKLKAAA